MFCFFSWLFEQYWARWLFLLLAHFFTFALINVGREIAESNSLTDITTIFVVLSNVMIWIILVLFTLFIIDVFWLSADSLLWWRKEKKKHPDTYFQPKGTRLM